MIPALLFSDLSLDWIGSASALAIPAGLALSALMLYAPHRALRSVYVQQGRRFSRCRLTGRQAVGRLLEHAGLSSVGIEEGATIDQYDLLRGRVKLRTESSVSSSVAALAIAAHEVGHAEQFATGYWAARATRWLLVLLVLSAAVILVYPFATTIAGADVNLTGLLACAVLVALLRMPIAIALENDATKRGQRLLKETGLAHEMEHDGIAQVLRAGLRVHVAFSAALVLLISAGVAVMWLVENEFDTPTLVGVQVAPPIAIEPGGSPPPMPAIEITDGINYPLVAILVSIATVWWAFSGKKRKTPTRTAPDASNEGMSRFQSGLPGAIALFDEALRLDPGLASAHYNRAVALASQGRNPEALASLEAFFTCRTEDAEPLLRIADPWYLRGRLRLDQGDRQGAGDDLARALEIDPDLTHAHELLTMLSGAEDAAPPASYALSWQC